MIETGESERDEIVSYEDEALILVDDQDRELGHLSKLKCHEGDGVLHRAFSLFVFNGRGELLLQQRAAGKRLWPLFWSNSCCSHPRRGERMTEAVHRRLWQELGIEAELDYLYKFRYQARYDASGAEHELCSVYLGVSDEAPRPNRQEIADWRWIPPAKLDAELVSRAEHYTPWFKMEWRRLRSEFADEIKTYTR
ncbi:isopentenyl-diphosphate Delta-isomerase [Halomonas sp. MA07-2]|uniref:isopentenyl-diphosphate Delta-isomerase n=1 Tax=unclassified Halomonas TaxID=2609666 RepID=UPI003EEBBF53